MATLTIGGKTVITQTGTDEPIIGSDVVFPAGHIIQIQQKTTNGLSTSSSSTGWIDTTLVHSITPKYESSMILISYNGVVGINKGTNHTRIDYRILNDTQSNTVAIKYYHGIDGVAAPLIQKSLSGIVYDFPSSINQQTYKIQVMKANGGSTTEAGSIIPDWYTGSKHQIILMEIAQ